jgi:multidrug efflux pump subunit AcrA (membrane-fusion protein)
VNTRYLIITILVVSLVAIAGCGDQSPVDTDHDHAHTASQMESAGPTNRVEIPPVVRNNLGITFATVERRHVSRTRRVPGRFELLPTARREYRMMISGHVELLVDQYDEVKAGQPLFRFRSAEWSALQSEIVTAEQNVHQSEAALRVAEATVHETERRLEILRARLDALSGAEVRRADLELQHAETEASLARLEAERDQAATRLRAAKMQSEQAITRAAAVLNMPREALLEHDDDSQPRYRTLDAVTVHAAEGGVVESIAVTNGAYVESAALALTVTNPERVRFRASILQSEFDRAIGSSAARIVPPQSSGNVAAEQIDATFTFGLEASPQQRTIELVAIAQDHRSWMRPGVSAFLEITLDGTDRPELAIPRSALMKDGMQHVFFRRDPRDPNAAIRIEADLGHDDGRWVIIRSGLRLGDEVVLDGAYELMLATAQSGSTMQGGHFHPDGTWHADH